MPWHGLCYGYPDMFVVSRHKGQKIAIGDEIELVVIDVSRSTVRLGIIAPKPMTILRSEIRESIEKANREAVNCTSTAIELELNLPQPAGPVVGDLSEALHGLGIPVTAVAPKNVKSKSSE